LRAEGDMRVELVAHNRIGSVSGIGRYVRELYRHLQPHVAARLVRPVDPPLAKRFTFLHHMPVGLEGHQRGSIVHFTQIMGCAMMLWRPVRPAVATVHDLGVLVCPEDGALFNQFDRLILRLQLAGLKRMDRYIVHSERSKDDLVSHLRIAENSITVVASSVDTELFRPISDGRDIITRRYGISFDDEAATLLYVGSEVPRKNLGLLLQAMHILRASGHRIRLLKVGGSGGDRWKAAILVPRAHHEIHGPRRGIHVPLFPRSLVARQ